MKIYSQAFIIHYSYIIKQDQKKIIKIDDQTQRLYRGCFRQSFNSAVISRL